MARLAGAMLVTDGGDRSWVRNRLVNVWAGWRPKMSVTVVLASITSSRESGQETLGVKVTTRPSEDRAADAEVAATPFRTRTPAVLVSGSVKVTRTGWFTRTPRLPSVGSTATTCTVESSSVSSPRAAI